MNCIFCQRSFTAVRSRQIYCGASCRVEAGRVRNREIMRVKRASFAPHPCLDCGTFLIGRSLRCPPCKSAEIQRVQRESKRLAQSTRAADINARRRDRRRESPDAIRAKERARSVGKLQRVKSDPARLEQARARFRKYAAKIRAEKESSILESLTHILPKNEPHP